MNNKKVDEQILYRLVQSVAIALFECNDAEDFGPAKILMNMCFTFYYEGMCMEAIDAMLASMATVYIDCFLVLRSCFATERVYRVLVKWQFVLWCNVNI